MISDECYLDLFGVTNRNNMSYIAEFTGRFKFNACNSDLFAKSPRGQIESRKYQIESPVLSNRLPQHSNRIA